MTSEIAVLTKQAVALAADSAGTLNENKIFNTVNKVFSLSKHQPVGVMVYSSSEVMGAPVETVIKEFRRIQGTTAYEHLDGYAQALETFLSSNTSVFSDAARLRALADIASDRVVAVARGAYDILPDSPEWGRPTKSEARLAYLKSLGRQEKRVYGRPMLHADHPVKLRGLVSRAIEDRLNQDIRETRSRFPISATTEQRIRRLALHCLLRDVEPGMETGFVIAGFGTGDVFPSLRAFEFCCSACGCHRVKSRVSVDVSNERVAYIHGFAQTNAMMSFVQGMDPQYVPSLTRFVRSFFREKKRQFRKDKKTADVVERIGSDLREALARELDQLGRDFYSPLMGVVASMPKEDLAVLAEALINLTALRMRASADAETVGGPTDVAVISKGDGLIWIKRKHYFDMGLNPTFGAISGAGGTR